MLWKLPKWQAAFPMYLPSQERFQREDEARKTLAQILGGAVLIISLWFTWENLNLTQRTTTKNLKLTERGQINDRFIRAVEQLGAIDHSDNPKLEVRLGGIYALERIASEAPDYYWPIMEILTAYVRENAPWKPRPLEAKPCERETPPSKEDLPSLKPRNDI